MIDLHTHSTASDGELQPAELIRMAAKIGIRAIALTDHDTTAGMEEALDESARLDICFIPGVEVDVEFEPGELHLLGLGFNIGSMAVLEEFLDAMRQRRLERNRDMLERIQRDHPNVGMDEFIGDKVIGRIHFAKFLMKTGKAKSIDDAFSLWLNPGRPYYVPKRRSSLREALEAIHQAGGKAVIAHPKSLKVEWECLEDLFSEWKTWGLDGIEAYHSGATWKEAEKLSRIAHDCNLFVTGGSDFHGSTRPERLLGRGAGKRILGQKFLMPFEVSDE